MEDLGGVKKWVAAFLGLGVFVAIASIVLSSVRSATTACGHASAVLNTTLNRCVNSSLQNITGVLGSFSGEYNATNNALTAVGNISTNFGTAGTLVGSY